MPLRKVGQLNVLELRGSPSDMGREHGEVLGAAVRGIVHDYLQKSDKIIKVPYEFLREQAQRCLPHIPQSYVKEMRALARASETAFEDILAFNCLVDVDGCYMQSILQCCNFIATPPATKGELVLHGRNLDFPPGRVLPGAAILMVRIPERGHPTVAVTWAGFIGILTGMSARHLTCGEITSPSADSCVEGQPLPFLIREILEDCDTLDGAAAHVANSQRTCGFNLALCDGKTGHSCAIEYTRTKCAVRRPERGVLVVDNVALCPETGDLRLTYPAGAFRLARMTDLLHKRWGRIDVDCALEFMRDVYDCSLAIEKGTGYNCICNMHTIQSVLFLPQEARMMVSHGQVPAPLGPYHELKLEDVLPVFVSA